MKRTTVALGQKNLFHHCCTWKCEVWVDDMAEIASPVETDTQKPVKDIEEK
jgi:hypothetical protein